MIRNWTFSVTSLLIFISAVSLALLSNSSLAATIRVPADQPTIQAGIDAATNLDTVLVTDGTYVGEGNRAIDFKGKAITVQSQNGPGSCIIDCEGSGWGFLFQNGESEASVLSGFTITGGWDGGIKCNHLYTYSGQIIWIPSSPTISNCIISNNRGIGISCYDSNPKINNCTIGVNTGVGIYCSSSSPKIADSTVSDNGGTGIYCISESSPEISNCTISSNKDKGIYCYTSSSPTITGCTVRENTSIGIQCTSSSPTIINSTIANNESWGIFCTTASPTITNCTVTGNEWRGIHCSYGSPIITGCVISNNKGTFSGGLEFEDCLSPKLVNCLITGNTTASYSNGGGIISSSSALTIINCTIAGNTAGESGGIEIQSGSSTIINTIVWGNTPSDSSINTETTLRFSDIEGGHSGTGNIESDPLFSNNTDYRVTPSSPCIDSGTSNGAPDTDIEGTSRPQGNGYDMGAYEFVPPCPNCSGDDVTIIAVNFPSRTCECIGTLSITIGPDVTIPKDATVTFKAPLIKVKPGFHAEAGAVVNMRRE